MAIIFNIPIIFSSHSKSLPFHQSKKFIVFEDCLLSLFVNCHKCGQETTEVTTKIIGTFLHIEQHCSTCLNVFTWDSQPFVKNQAAGNILLSAAILFSGACRPRFFVTSETWVVSPLLNALFLTSEQLSSSLDFSCLGEAPGNAI